ncbi:Cyclic di-GMP phosphodiesterase Gmr [Meiothermus luteus]|uniref:Cyclic di-GMP phosphodiesterase Gmr n=1 Tax=Meiothermus luteus TaxID=2026184 RepID=A0A399EBQ0_9DEIN|nr:EAL domain-containing protein [Meiothermus luteus]RIH81775.1 Cyclic di-GMP phosphodiesterase Gmr [Meiothermus luteus]RMH57952.1 MAG: EAL domain-containing protein [Deinococcota bacterium]
MGEAVRCLSLSEHEEALRAALGALARGLGVPWAYARGLALPGPVWASLEGEGFPLEALDGLVGGLSSPLVLERAPGGLGGLLALPLAGGGVLAFADRRPRRWSPEEQGYLRVAGALLWGFKEGWRAEELWRHLELLFKLGWGLSAELDGPGVFRYCVEAIAETFGYNLVSIYLKEGDELVLQHQVGYAEWLERVPIGSGVMARCVRSGKPMLVEDAAQDPDFIYPMPGILSEVAVPLRVDGKTIGVLNVESTARRLGPADLELLKLVGRAVGLFLERDLAVRRLVSSQAENARLLQKTQAQARRLGLLYALSRGLLSVQSSEEATRLFVEELHSSFGYGLVAVYYLEGKVLVARHHRGYYLNYARIPLGQGVTSRCYLSGHSILLQNPTQDPDFLVVNERVCSALFVPIRVRGEVVGTVNVEEDKRLLDGADLELVEAATALLQATLERLQTLNSLAQSEQRFRTLVEHLPLGVLLFDPGTLEIRYANPKMHELLGVKELRGVSMAQLWTGDNTHHVLARVERLRRGEPGLPWMEQPLHKADGGLLEAETTGLALPQEGLILSIVRDISERKAAERRMEFLAFHDPLTGLLNRAGLVRQAGALLRPGGSATLLYIDLNETKMVNDAYGHPAGDELIRQVAERLRGLPVAALVARVGGDEFVLLLEGQPPPEELGRMLRVALEAPFWVADRELHITLSVGAACYPEHGKDLSELMRTADVAMYQAKRGGRLWLGYTPELDQGLRSRLEALQRLRGALKKKQIQPYFQPIVELRSGVRWGLEALARWVGEGLPPDLFIPLAEEAGLVHQIDRLVLCQALRLTASREERLTLNLSPRSLLDENLLRWLERVLGQWGFPAHRLWLEVTESVLMDNPVQVRARLGALKEMGLNIALDDFGSGYSSLSYLSELPIDLIKIDRRFTAGIGKSQRSEAILRSVVALAQNLGLLCLAEGVERPEQRAWLQEVGCALGQGYLFGPPQALE